MVSVGMMSPATAKIMHDSRQFDTCRIFVRLASAGAELWLRSNLSFIAKFDGKFAAHSQTYAGTGTIRYVW